MKKKIVLIAVCALGIIAQLILLLFITGVIPHMKYFTKELKNAVDDSNSAHYLIYKGKTYYKNDMLEYPYFPMYLEDYDKKNLKIIGWSGFRFHPIYYISYTDNDPIVILGERNFAVYLREDYDFRESFMQIIDTDVKFRFIDVFKSANDGIAETSKEYLARGYTREFEASVVDMHDIYSRFIIHGEGDNWFLIQLGKHNCYYELSPEFVDQLKECGVIKNRSNVI